MRALLVFAFLILSAGCRRDAPAAPPEPEVVSPVNVSWQKPLLCQPRLRWGDGSTTHQGTSFFVRAPNGKLAAVSSAHFLDFDGSPLQSAQWLNVRTGDVVADFTTGWGAPKPNAFSADLRDDFWIMPVAASDASRVQRDYEVLQFDTRMLPELGERVWFPDKDDSAELGFRRVPGTVAHAETNEIIVELDPGDGVQLQSQSGSPVVSQKSGRVIGTVFSGGRDSQRMYLRLAPVVRMRIRIEDESNFPELKTVVGKTK